MRYTRTHLLAIGSLVTRRGFCTLCLIDAALYFNFSLSFCSVLYLIVIARGQRFMAVNRPSPRAQLEDKVGLRHLNASSLANLMVSQCT